MCVRSLGTGGGATYWSYDALGRATCRQDARGTVVYYAYDAVGNRTELTVQGEGTVYYEYDEAGRMTEALRGATGPARRALAKEDIGHG